MTIKTERLTAAEIAKIDSLPIFNELQRAVLAARKRTGLRINVAIGGGRWFVQVLAFATKANGKVTGTAGVRELGSFSSSASVQSFIEAL